MAPPEERPPEFLGEDYQRHVVDDDHRQVPGHREVGETIRKKSAETGSNGMGVPRRSAAGGVDVRTRGIVGEHLADRPPGFHGAVFGGAGGPARSTPPPTRNSARSTATG